MVIHMHCDDKAMKCSLVIGIKSNFGDQGASFVLLPYDVIVYQMQVLGLGILPCGLETSCKSELCIGDE